MKQGSKFLMAATGAAALLIGAEAGAAVISDTNSTFGSVDASGDSRTFSFGAGDFAGTDGMIDKVTIEITFSKCSSSAVSDAGCGGSPNDLPNDFTFPDEIGFSLMSPDGTEIILVFNQNSRTVDAKFNRIPPTFDIANTGGDLSLITILFDDTGAALPTIPVNGIFAPEELLAGFIGENPIGLWTLDFEDDQSGDPLGFHSATLNITATDLNGRIPEPATMALLGLGLAGIGVARRRKPR